MKSSVNGSGEKFINFNSFIALSMFWFSTLAASYSSKTVRPKRLFSRRLGLFGLRSRVWERLRRVCGSKLREDSGVETTVPPKRVFKIDGCPETGFEFVWVYRCDSEGPFTLHPDEIECGGWFTPIQ